MRDNDLAKRLRDTSHMYQIDCELKMKCADRIEQLVAINEELESKLEKAVGALRGSRETILELVNSRWSETEGTDEDWVGDIDTIIAEIKGSK